MSKRKVIVIGAGASGLMAAGQSAEAGADTILIEKMNRPAMKLRITGKGRCNITNIAPVADFVSHFGANGKFLRQAFSRFFNSDLIDFYSRLGLKTVTERGGRVFPESGEANEVVSIMIDWIKRAGVKMKTGSPVSSLVIENGCVTGVRIRQVKGSTDEVLPADAVIIATGGASYPGTGSTGDGYALAEAAGHTVIETRPALVPLDTTGETASRLEGLSLRNVKASAWVNGKKASEEFGDMLFTANGVSGPVILTLSGLCVDALRAKSKVVISIDLKPALDHKVLDERLMRDIKNSPTKNANNLLKGLLPERLIAVCIESTGINGEKKSNQISSDERKRLRVWLKDFRLDVTGHRPIAEAIITAGGVSTKEVNPRTMESRIVKGLYFSGEVLDINADTGGYNLQAAFSTGWLAGRSAAAGAEE
ncbi:MAG: NAD(P)/FAD-dependent oxidoreductase [Spirochaetota bacterium]